MIPALLFLAGFLGWVLCLAVPLGALLYAVYFLVSLPLRRRERARLFLDLLELGLSSGHSAEQSILTAARSHDRVMGVRFHLVAAYLDQGLRLEQALAKVPRFLPPQINAMLRV